MSGAVEILVPQPALPAVRKALGSLPSTSFRTRPSSPGGPHLVVSSLDILDTPGGRSALEELLRAFSGKKGVPIVLFETVELAPGLAGLGALARLSGQARQDPYIAPSFDAVRRIVLSRRSGAERELIASASMDDGKLVVWSCEPRRFEVPVSEIAVLAEMSADALSRFELSRSGSRLRWPDADVDINLDTIREHADPEVRREHQARARQDAARYADAIRRVREEHGLKQSDIDGLTDRQVRRLEEGDTLPQIETLRRLAAAHGLTIDPYLRELASRSGQSSRRRSTRTSGRQARTRR
jgi:ribosome-binding protein aMBF1 (putative translation factor)